MKKLAQVVSVASALVVGASLVFGTALPASATAATLPDGEVLHGYSYDRVDSFDGVINVATGAATPLYPSLPSSDIPSPEGAGYDSSTGKTWVVSDSTCDLWEVHDDGTVTNRFHLVATVAEPQLVSCYALMLNNDDTAYVAAKINGTGTRLFKIDLADGTLIGSPVVTAQIGALAKDPTTGQVWAAVVIGTTGLYKFDVATGALTDRQTIHDSVLNQDIDIWDMTFDSRGTLWMSAWGNDCILASIDPDAADPQATYNHVDYTRHNGATWWTDAMWITTDSGAAQSGGGTTDGSDASALASTGLDAGLGAAGALGAFGLLVTGAVLLVLRRRS